MHEVGIHLAYLKNTKSFKVVRFQTYFKGRQNICWEAEDWGGSDLVGGEIQDRKFWTCLTWEFYLPIDGSWVFFGRNDAKAETPVLWPPHVKSWLIGKDSDAGRDWGQEEKGKTEDEMVGWHHRLNGREFEWTAGVGDGQGGLACCDSWGGKVSDTTERLNWTELIDCWVAIPVGSRRQSGIQGRGQSWSCTFMSHCHITRMAVKATRPGWDHQDLHVIEPWEQSNRERCQEMRRS